MEIDAYIALGSNLGDRELQLLRAVAELGKLPDSRVTALSRFYETTPVGMPADTPSFYNAVARISTRLQPVALLEALQRIEQELFGRCRSATPQSRRMDLDLLLYGDRQLNLPHLTIPHPRMLERRFVLQPLADIAPDCCPPGSSMTIARHLALLVSDELVTALP